VSCIGFISVKTHFQATLSNISFTVYALLPTLSAQLLSLLDVEALTDELKGIAAASAAEASKPPRMTDSGMASWAASSESDANSKSLESSAVLSSAEGERDVENSSPDKAESAGFGLGIQTDSHGQGQDSSSWVQEFTTTQSHNSNAPLDSDMSDLGATSAGEDGVSTRTYLVVEACR
jgi:peroxin-3